MIINIKSNYFLLYLLSVLIALPIYSQIRELEGTVSDNMTKEPIPYVTVILKNSKNDFLVGTTTNEEGQFILKYKEGNYNFELSFMGYKTHNSTIELNQNLTQDIKLSPEEFTIDEVTIVGETTTVKQLIDKKVIHVGKDILSNGGSAATVLSQLSEVDADESGSISLRGNSNVQVLINGKPSPLNTAELLAQVSASEIKTIEIITSPSAKYKADGLTGIINILTKKKVKKGITSNNSLSFNSLKEFSGSSSLSYGANKVNYIIGVFYRKNKSESKRTKERFGTRPYLEESTNKYQGDVYRLNAGMDWFINKNNEFSWSVNYSNNEHHTDIDKIILEADITSFQYNLSSHLHKTLQLNGNYRYTFKNEEDFLELDIDFSKNNNTLKGFFQPNISILDNLVDNEILTSNIALDNSFKLSKPLKIETGYLWYKQELDNMRTLFNDLNVIFSKDLYTTEQSTHALYTQVNYDYEKLGVQVGLRGELYNRKAVFITDNTNVDNTFTDFFPSLHLKYTPNEIYTFGVGYNRRTYRPRLYQINPISSQSDEFTFRKGNPNLKPEFSDNIDLTNQFKKGKYSISSTISYRKIESLILQNQTINNEGVQILSYINGGSSNSYGLELALSYKPLKWLRSNFNFNWNYEDLQSLEEVFPVDFSRSYQFTFKNNIKINKKMTSNISWRYRGKSVDFYGERDKTQKVDIGFKYKVLKNKGNLSLRFTDIFDDYIYKGIELGEDFKRKYVSKRVSRAVHIAFTYNFNKGKIEKRNKKDRDYE